jgi:hypothetical protein
MTSRIKNQSSDDLSASSSENAQIIINEQVPNDFISIQEQPVLQDLSPGNLMSAFQPFSQYHALPPQGAVNIYINSQYQTNPLERASMLSKAIHGLNLQNLEALQSIQRRFDEENISFLDQVFSAVQFLVWSRGGNGFAHPDHSFLFSGSLTASSLRSAHCYRCWFNSHPISELFSFDLGVDNFNFSLRPSTRSRRIDKELVHFYSLFDS